jgi:cytochrome b561
MGNDASVQEQKSPRYTKTAIALHWLMAVPMLGLLLFGKQTMGSHNAHFLPTVHASLGLLIVLMFGFRLYWRWRNLPPSSVNGVKWERIVAKLAHVLLYASLVLIPLTGWIAYTEHVRRSLGMRPASWFGFKIPLLPDFGINWHMLHKWGGKAVLVLIILHVAAVFKHHFYDRDDTLRRMLHW